MIVNHKKEYFFEIDISNYKIGENIIFYITTLDLRISYQYKKIFNGKNLISDCFDSYFISIKKVRDDSSLIINFENTFSNLIILNLIKVEEIKSDYQSVVNGPKFFFIDYNLLNGMNSIGMN